MSAPLTRRNCTIGKSSINRRLSRYTASQSNATSDPVVLWLNGGPGCSSLQGTVIELGPYRVHGFGETVYLNQYSWNRVRFVSSVVCSSPISSSLTLPPVSAFPTRRTAAPTTMTTLWRTTLMQLFLTSSTINSPSSKATTSTSWVSHLTGEFSGESYGGTYVPMLATRLINDSQNFSHFKVSHDPWSGFIWQGIAIGNGCLNERLNYNSVIQYSYNHGFIDES